MEDEIINRVAASKLEVFDLEDYYPAGNRTTIDIAQWLDEGLILREKDFRETLDKHDWQQYAGALVSIYCSTDAILPAWASILVAVKLAPFAKESVFGPPQAMDEFLYRQVLSSLDYSIYDGKAVIIKGCTNKPVPPNAYLLAAKYLSLHARSIMYGEACSAVPLYKKSR
ncbi:MAG: DUF2480 family protein [Flavobacterium sp.]|nr:MAG: DUF2480 family protein [Flavobacterium sp.]